tara:strand:- start:13137 stop:14108 length:972 start_codon:yes stop_codon:yes gene_type:complete
MLVLVTGGAGYIGSHTVKELVKEHDVIIYDNLTTGHKKLIDSKANFIEGDLSDYEKLNQIFKEHKIDAVIHFSAYSLVGESIKDPIKYYQNNVVNSLNLLKAMVENNVNKLIFSSSAAIYGTPKELPIKESHPLNPINPYGETKMIFERLLRYFDRSFNLKSISLRYFNVAGASPLEDIGENHENETHLIPSILETALGKRNNIKIFGNDYNTNDGTCIRDFVHVVDIAKAHILALNYLNKNMETKSYNIGSKNGYSVKEIIDLCKEITKKNIEVINEDRREGDPSVLIADSSRFKEEIGWKEQYDIKDMIQHAWNWHKSQEN